MWVKGGGRQLGAQGLRLELRLWQLAAVVLLIVVVLAAVLLQERLRDAAIPNADLLDVKLGNAVL